MISCLRTRYLVNLCKTYQTNQEKAKLNALRSDANHPLKDYFTTDFYNSKLDFGPMKSHRVTVTKAHRIQIIPRFFFCSPFCILIMERNLTCNMIMAKCTVTKVIKKMSALFMLTLLAIRVGSVSLQNRFSNGYLPAAMA